MSEHEHLDIEVHELNIRVSLIEKDLALIAGMRKWVVAGVVTIMLQAGGVIYTYGQLTVKVEQMTSSTLPIDVSSNRRVLSDHSSEIQQIRIEQARVRERIDILNDMSHSINDMDFSAVEGRVARLENVVYTSFKE